MHEHLQALLAGGLIMVIGYFGYSVLFRTPEELQLLVTKIEGTVVRTDALGAQQDALPGMTLQPSDALSVGPESHAHLSIGEDTRLTLSPESHIRILGIEEVGVRVELEEGKVSAWVRPGSPALSLSSRGRAATATDASFTMATDSDGGLSINTEDGVIQLDGIDGADLLQPGTQLRTIPGSPAVVGPIPEELLLDVMWPELLVTREDLIYVEGNTAPYAEIAIHVQDNETRIRAHADGSFRTAIFLENGTNTVELTAHDGMGNQRQITRDVERSVQLPPLNVEASWGE